ncbi:MAG: low molecular weight protein-tyrosine-phosphatase [Motiliproteus sp.]
MSTAPQYRSFSVLFVCLANICRSPTAHGVFQQLASLRGLNRQIQVESAGTGAYHIGCSPDHRSIKVAAERGYDLKGLQAQKTVEEDFRRFDYILAMDNDNLKRLREIEPVDSTATVQLFLDFSSQQQFTEVPDPYYGGARGFDLVLDLIEDASAGLLDQLQRRVDG